MIRVVAVIIIIQLSIIISTLTSLHNTLIEWSIDSKKPYDVNDEIE